MGNGSKKGGNVGFPPNILGVLDAKFSVNHEFVIKYDRTYDLTNLWAYEVMKAVVVGGRVMVAKSL